MTTEPQNPPAILKKVDTIEKLEAFLKKKKKSSKDHSNYDILFRYFINKNTPEDQLDHLLEIFLPKLDGNFQSQSNGNTTPMMHLVGEGLNSLCEQLIEKIGESLDLTLKDNEQENIFFKIINSSNDNRKVNLFKMALTLLKEDSEEEEKKETLDVINSSGKSLIESALNIGNSDISSMLLMEGIDPKIKNEVTGDNLLHFAIRGKNPFCLKMVLNTVEQDSIYEFIKETNKDNETPIQLANKLNISTIVKQLNDFISGEKKSKISGENNEDEIYDLLSQLTEDNTDKIVSTISKNYYVSDWNKLFLEIIKKNQSNQKYDPELNKKINDYFNFNKELDEIDENMEKKDNFLYQGNDKDIKEIERNNLVSKKIDDINYQATGEKPLNRESSGLFIEETLIKENNIELNILKPLKKDEKRQFNSKDIIKLSNESLIYKGEPSKDLRAKKEVVSDEDIENELISKLYLIHNNQKYSVTYNILHRSL